MKLRCSIHRQVVCGAIPARFLRSSVFLALASVATLVVLPGCGGGGMGSQNLAPLALRGRVYGGQQAVSGSTIQLYAAGATGYGSSATALLTTTVTTDAFGNFTITHDYTCPTASTQVYIVSRGGNPGLGAGTNNSALALMAALGSCGDLGSSTFLWIDEVTTVASVYALAPFMSTGGGANLGASSTNAQGLTNAFAAVHNLVSTTSGMAPGPNLPTGATAPTTELNTLADILAPCVNSNGSTGECSALISDATPSGGTAPTNTLDAALDIAKNPVNNVSALYNLMTGTAPFQPTLASAPNDWTVAIIYSGSGLSTPWGVAVDAPGNVWVANHGSSAVSEFSSVGVGLSGSGFSGGGLDLPYYVAIDLNGDAWLTNSGNNTLSEFSSSGNAISTSSGYTGDLEEPYGIAIDGSDNGWVGSQNELINKFSNAGSVLSVGYYPETLYYPAIDQSGNVWIAGTPQYLIKFNSSDGFLAQYSGGGLDDPVNVAIDQSGNVWLANSAGSRVSEFSSTGGARSPSGGYSNGGLGGSSGLGIDGLGNVWVTNNGTNTLSKLSNTGNLLSGLTGYLVSGLDNPISLAIDGSGNVWVTDANDNSLTEVVGAAAPVVTPLAAAVENGAIAQRP
jgi:streptogramin lyase